MRAVILAGGEGRRLHPFTMVIPKPLVPLGNHSILEIVLRQLRHAGFERITLAVGYHGELIMAVIGDGSKFDLRIGYNFEAQPLGTIGPLANIEGLNETFLVMNGDILTDLDYAAFMAYHKQQGGIATIASYRLVEQISLGVLECDAQNRITNFQEKPQYEYQVSMGIYAFEPSMLKYIPKDQPMGFDDLMLKLLEEKEPVFTYPFKGEWIDIGRHDDFAQALDLFESKQSLFLR